MFSRRKITGIVLSLALLVGSGGAFAAQQTEYVRIENEMQEIRGLDLFEPLDISTQNRDELRQFLIDTLKNDYPEAEQERDQRVLTLFGLVDPDTNLGQLQIDLLGEQVAGYYDPETKEMVVVSDGSGDSMSASEEVTFVHETVHALQDQNFDLALLQDESVMEADDHYLALSALIEGDASFSEVQYMIAHPKLIIEVQSEVESMDSSILDSTPPYISGTLLFPYQYGLEFITALHEEGGQGLVDEAFTSPPVSTEQILHPEKYLADEEPISVTVNDPMPALGDNWEILHVNNMGEFITSLFLDTGEVRPSAAKDAAEGWGGDQYVVAGTDEDTALVWSTEWDTPEDAEEFFSVLGTHESNRFDVESQSDDAVKTFNNDDVAGEIRIDGTNVIYILAPDTETTTALFDNQETSETPATEPGATPVASPVS